MNTPSIILYVSLLILDATLFYLLGFAAGENAYAKRHKPKCEEIPGLEEFILCWYICDEYKELFPIPTYYQHHRITEFTESGFYFNNYPAISFGEYSWLFKKDHILYQPLVVEAKIKMEEEKRVLEQKKLAAIEEFNEIRKEISI